MAFIRPPIPVKLIVGMLCADPAMLSEARRRLEALYGPVDVAGDVMPFTWTSYYIEEMGPGLLRQFLAFERLISPEQIVAIKRQANDLEDEFTRQAGAGNTIGRAINLDPGYVTKGKLVLASAKDFSHRVYLGQGIYAEVTLRYVHGRWQGHSGTFPDYACGAYDGFLTAARTALLAALGSKEPKP